MDAGLGKSESRNSAVIGSCFFALVIDEVTELPRSALLKFCFASRPKHPQKHPVFYDIFILFSTPHLF